MISPDDVELMRIIDRPEEVIDAIFSTNEKRGFMPSLAERENPVQSVVPVSF